MVALFLITRLIKIVYLWINCPKFIFHVKPILPYNLFQILINYTKDFWNKMTASSYLSYLPLVIALIVLQRLYTPTQLWRQAIHTTTDEFWGTNFCLAGNCPTHLARWSKEWNFNVNGELRLWCQMLRKRFIAIFNGGWAVLDILC